MTAGLPRLVRFGRAICGDLAQAERREWWLTNGRGGYAAGTVAGSLTRRYHGLLVAPVDPPLGRRLVVAKADAVINDGSRQLWLTTNRWGDGSVAPRGYLHLESFALHGRMPVWRFALGDARLEQRIWMEPGRDTTWVAYRLDPGSGGEARWRLRASLLANARDHHGATRAGAFAVAHRGGGGHLEIGLPACALHVYAPGGRIEPRQIWYENFRLAAEEARGLDPIDNHLCVAELTLDLEPEVWAGFAVGLEPEPGGGIDQALHRHQARDEAVLARAERHDAGFATAPDWIRQLVLAADGFVFARPVKGGGEGESIIAGYPWFGDWGRDTMIALPGLTLCTGRTGSARRILQTFARYVDRGMLPNVFPGSGETPDYNSVDAALWYVEAWRAYLEATGDEASTAAALPALVEIAEACIAGTRHGIAMDPGDALLRAGAPGVQLTWMDAKVGDWVVTPRIGKPVEVNALWYNALRILAELAGRLGDAAPATRYAALAERVRESFRRYLRADGQGLHDVLDGPDGTEAKLRPNQILAVSLPHSPLDRRAREAVVAACAGQLATSYGLRSLAPGEPGYRARYLGGVRERDGAYHQGPVWSWLLGHFALARLRVDGDPRRAMAVLAPLADHLLDAGLGTVSEIFDGEEPHTPRGAPSQAWSVACALEAWLRIDRAGRGRAHAETDTDQEQE